MLLDGSQPEQPLAGRHSDGGGSSGKVRSVDGDGQKLSKADGSPKGSSSGKNKRSKARAKKKQPEKQLGEQSKTETLNKYEPPNCYNANTCPDVKLRVITTKRITRCVVRYCKCPRCGRTFKLVETLP